MLSSNFIKIERLTQWEKKSDLVWSYSRSQAFYGENIATSPSFTDRRWAGPRPDPDTESMDDDEDEDEEDFSTKSIDEDDEEETLTEDEYEDTLHYASPAGQLDWPEEQLPRNAVASQRNQLGRRERRERRGTDRGGAVDRRLRSLAREDRDGDEERSRSRSRSPKRLTSSSGGGGGGGGGGSGSGGPSRPTSRLRLPSSPPPTKTDTEAVGERTPLLKKANSSSTMRFRRQGYGSSTFWQSWFNTVNALIGVGILALPLAISYAGLVSGTILFIGCGLVTNYTGKVLAKIMRSDPSLKTYADIGICAFGPRARWAVSAFFCIELWAVATALIILFGDSALALARNLHFLAGLPPAVYKAVGLALVLPTVFLPLRLLSPVSVVGIVSVTTLFFVVFADGFIKKEAPGSLLDPMPLHMGPQWIKLPLSFGLIMSGFSSHPIIPSLCKDMRDPRMFDRMLDLAYIAATCIYLAMGIVGYIMFGQNVSDEITRDVARTEGYPRVLNRLAICLIIINPLSKFALAARPILTTVEVLLGIDTPNKRATKSSQIDDDAAVEEEVSESPMAGSAFSHRAQEYTSTWSPAKKRFLTNAVSLIVTLLIGLTAIVLPGFEKVMAFLGAFLACATCIIGPLLAHLKLFHREMRRREIILQTILLVLGFIMAIIGTVWSFLDTTSLL